jgi:hypothetical protein
MTYGIVDFLLPLGHLLLIELTFIAQNWPSALLVALSFSSMPAAQRTLAIVAGSITAAAGTVASVIGIPYALGFDYAFICGGLIVIVSLLIPAMPVVEELLSVGAVTRRLALIAVGVIALKLVEPLTLARAAVAGGRLELLAASSVAVFIYATIGALLLGILRSILRPAVVTVVLVIFGLAGVRVMLEASQGVAWLKRLETLAGASTDVLWAVSMILAATVLSVVQGVRTQLFPVRGRHWTAVGTLHQAVDEIRTSAVRWQQRLRAALSVLGVLFALGPTTLAGDGTHWVEMALFMALLATLLAYIVMSRRAQNQRNAVLSIVYDPVKGMRSRYFLYLRSFNIGKSTMLRRAYYHVMVAVQLWSRYKFGELFEFEEEIADALEPWGLLVAIGDRQQSYGAAKLNTGEGWRSDFFKLANGAELIFFAPAATDHVQWEAAQIMRDPNLEAKAIWVMPAGVSEELWREISEVYRAKFKLEIPAYTPSGVVFRSGGMHRTVLQMPLRIFTATLAANGRVAALGINLTNGTTLAPAQDVKSLSG